LKLPLPFSAKINKVKGYRFHFALPGCYLRSPGPLLAFLPGVPSHSPPPGRLFASARFSPPPAFASIPVLSSASDLRAPIAPSSVGQRRKTRVPVNSKDRAVCSVLPSYPPLTWVELPLQVGRDPLTASIGLAAGYLRLFFPLIAISGSRSGFRGSQVCLLLLGRGRFFMDRRLPWSVPGSYLVAPLSAWLVSVGWPPFWFSFSCDSVIRDALCMPKYSK
jgi:hypothetical protein